MKIYISLPVAGHNIEHCRQRAETVKRMIERKGHHAATPFDTCQDPPHRMGGRIDTLLQCDAILRCTGWSYSKECALESECAHIYNKTIYDHVSRIGRAR